nr:ParB/RepB/Spo0J family partition protein [Burkholderiaceae bacterium]
MSKPKGLGRGLEALLGGDTRPPSMNLEEQRPAPPPREVLLSRLQPGRYQPRTRMDETALQELAASITAHGMMQPIVVRPIDGPVPAAGDLGAQRYEIIAGERRFRAAGLAGLQSVPVVVKEVADEQALALALIENIQREDLNPLEEAQAIRRLLDEFGYSHERAAAAIGRSRSAASNLLRLLTLAEPVQTMLLAGDLDMGHARALLALDRAAQTMVAQQVVQKRLSVRETERIVAREAASD